MLQREEMVEGTRAPEVPLYLLSKEPLKMLLMSAKSFKSYDYDFNHGKLYASIILS